MAPTKPAIHEVDFCSQMASAANALILQNPGIYPFREVRVEGFGNRRGPSQAQGSTFLRRPRQGQSVRRSEASGHA